MDLPILKYVDILIGLAVVVLLICTVVTAITQVLLSFTYSRARYLRNGLEDLIRQVDPPTLNAHARYIAERCLRHPLVARNNTPFGEVTGWLRNLLRRYWPWSTNHLLPELNPPDVLQREELILMLLEWAAGEGSMTLQDDELIDRSVRGIRKKLVEALAAEKQAAGKVGLQVEKCLQNLSEAPALARLHYVVDAAIVACRENLPQGDAASDRVQAVLDEHAAALERAKSLAEVRLKLKSALENAGVPDPAAAAAEIRARIVILENANPAQASATTRSQAIVGAAPSDFVARIHVWFDNTMTRIGDQYGLLAQVWAAILAFAVVFTFQFDALDLIRRLAQDDKLRSDLVHEAEQQTARIDTAKARPASDAQAQEIDDATVQRRQISESLAVLRDPNRSIIPPYFLWQKVPQTLACFAPGGLPPAGARPEGRVSVGADGRSLSYESTKDAAVDDLALAIRSSGAPVAVYPVDLGGQRCLRLVARDANAGEVAVSLKSAGTIEPRASWMDYDRAGARDRLGGMLVAAIMVSLGAPFWYGLLKKLFGFRSTLAQKDDGDRQQRQDQQAPAPPRGSGAAAG